MKLQLNINRVIRRLFVQRKHKDRLFIRAFSDKKDMLELYNALNGSHYDNPDDLEVTTLEDAIYMSFKNDLSFIVASALNLYEHQSTINPNMPIRGLIYFARMYEAYIKLNKLDIYGNTLVKLPLPQYIVFYNGTAQMGDEQTIKLSDAFMASPDGLKPMLECDCKVMNINYGHNAKILDTCKRLHDYSFFIEKVRELRGTGLDEKVAIEAAMDYCIQNNILVDILEKHRSEVLGMLLFTYDEKLHKQNEKNENIAEGRAQGLAEGLEQGLAQGRSQGRAESTKSMQSLLEKLFADNRIDDIKKISEDTDYLNKLLKEYNIQER